MTSPVDTHPVRAGGQAARGATLELKGLTKSFGPVRALDGIDLTTAAGEFVTLLGASGSGKTTTLNLVAGFLRPDAGTVVLDGQPIAGLPTHRRNIGLVFQDYLLFPHMTAFDNVAFPLRRRKVGSAEIRRRVEETLDLVGLHGLGRRYPRELSGGQQQRVALARAIVFRPPLLLMDEPLGALDRNLREVLQLEIRRIHRELGTTFIYVTHDQEEALVLSDRIAVFNSGRIEQLDSPATIYDRPATTFVARFVGDSNIFRGRLTGSDQSRLQCGRWSLLAPPAPGVTDPCAIVVRPEKTRLGPISDPAGNQVSGTVVERVYLGSALKVVVDVPDLGRVLVHTPPRDLDQVEAGAAVDVTWRAADSVLVPDSGTQAAETEREAEHG